MPVPPVMAAHRWRNNSELIAVVASLGYIGPVVLDPTYGRGKWWTQYKPVELIGRDRYRGPCCDPEWDYEAMDGIEPETIDTVAFDPPYVARGGRKTTGKAALDHVDRYGNDNNPATPELLLESICKGISASWRVLKPGGTLLVKASDYISSGHLFCGAHHLWTYATHVPQAPIGAEVDDTRLMYRTEAIFIHLSGAGMQPPNNLDGTPRRQVHPRNNFSYLYVFRKPKGSR